jgi:uncharacterized alkaline shock family protein YloU
MTSNTSISPNKGRSIETQLKPELPETIFSSDIENKVYQGIVLNTLASIENIQVLDGNFFHSLIGRSDKVKGIHVEQDPDQQSVRIQLEVHIKFGCSIPEKAEEIQNKVSREVSKMTGVHVSEVHVIFLELIAPEMPRELKTPDSVLNKLGALTSQKDLDDQF